ncbi:DeoR/GlpR family DNA-binding transcription regulator [Bacillus timonensis]|nr:DeoR/GlpR family DNA-binding transcription regulator [Bacillus timonensis]
MFQEERLTLIMQHLKVHKRVSLEELCALFSISRDTARRDIVKLDEQGRIIRTRGGAILPTITKKIHTYEQRLLDAPEIKREIGKVAASLVKDGDYLLLDASTTVQFVAENLITKQNVVVTNSIDIAGILAHRDETNIHLLGGKMNTEHRFIYGPQTINMVKEYHVDKLFLGACGITSEGLSSPYEEEGFLIREMINHADQVIVLIDQTKFHKKLFHNVCSLDKIDIIITDREPDKELNKIMSEFEIELITTGGFHSP